MIGTQCQNCKHYLGEGTCAAFYPKRIPQAILLGEENHNGPVKGDKGLRFEPIGDGLRIETMLRQVEPVTKGGSNWEFISSGHDKSK